MGYLSLGSYVRKGLLTGLAMLASYLPMQPRQANAELLWELYASPIVADWNPSNPGDELRITYNLFNNSDTGDANNLINFSITAGALHGVYNTTVPSGWTAQIFDDYTTFSGNGGYISPGNADTFRIFSYNTSTSLGQANATSVGEGYGNVPFPTLDNITIPGAIPEPSTVSLMLLGAGALLRRKRDDKWRGEGERRRR
jgi:hypothetical protein